ncbi:MAG: hypothetical protein GZ087_11385 [Flavobacterium sp.]|nr:hypothetical protein [Flavobacterium sp.]
MILPAHSFCDKGNISIKTIDNQIIRNTIITTSNNGHTVSHCTQGSFLVGNKNNLACA